MTSSGRPKKTTPLKVVTRDQQQQQQQQQQKQKCFPVGAFANTSPTSVGLCLTDI